MRRRVPPVRRRVRPALGGLIGPGAGHTPGSPYDTVSYIAPLPAPSAPPVTLRPLERRDLAFSARLHASALPHGFFVSLGPRFLRAYHRSFVDSPYGVALVALVDGDPAGFVVGTADDGRHYHHVVRRQWWLLLPAALAGLARHPGLAWRFARTRLRRYARGFVRLRRGSPPPSTASTSAPAAAGPQGVLTHIAVSTDRRGEGVGLALMSGFKDAVRAGGGRRLRVVTQAGDAGAARFYVRTGWESGGRLCDAEGTWWEAFAVEL